MREQIYRCMCIPIRRAAPHSYPFTRTMVHSYLQIPYIQLNNLTCIMMLDDDHDDTDNDDNNNDDDDNDDDANNDNDTDDGDDDD